MSARRRTNEELAFLERYDPGAFDRPSVAVDVVLLTVRGGRLATLLHRREEHPDRGRWSLPGGFVALDESLEDAAARTLATKAGVERVFLEQLFTFGDPARDPRMRVISVAYYALVPEPVFEVATGSAAPVEVPWEGEEGGDVACIGADGAHLPLAFDHDRILATAVQRIRGKLSYVPIAFELLGPTFTLLEVRRVYEAILGRPLNKDSFRRTVLASGLIEPTGDRQTGVGHRPAALYRRVPSPAPPWR